MSYKNRLFTVSSFFVLVVLFSSFGLSAQDSIIQKSREKYADARAFYLKKSYEFVISIEKDELHALCNIHEQKLINKSTGINYNTDDISFNSFLSINNIEATTLIPNKKKYIKKEVKKFELEDDIDGGLFYDDQQAYKFVYPSVQEGVILDLKYQQVYNEPRFLGSNYWSEYIPTVDNELVIRVDNDVHIGYKLFNCDSIDLEFTKEVGKKTTVYRWHRKSTGAINDYGNAPNFRYFEPHMIFFITDYTINGETKTILGEPKDLYAWYRSLIKNVNQTDDENLKKISDSVAGSITDEDEKVKKIFYWVQDNISYVAFEDGLGGFVPRDASLVCNRKFGDCKDMASIICEMLRYVDVKAYPTWIGSRSIPYKYTEVATPQVDNHMIASYQDKNGVWHYLDATGKKAPLELFTSMIQGKQALIGISPDSFLIETVPVKDMSVNQIVDSITISVNDNLVEGEGNVKLTGYFGLHYLYRTDRLSKQDYQDYFKSYFSKGSNKVIFSDVVKPIGNREDLNLTYDFKLDNYVRKSNDEMYINLNMSNDPVAATLPDDRKAPVKSTFKMKSILVTTFMLPEGYHPNYIPENEKYENKIGGISSEYIQLEDRIVHTTTYYYDFLMLNVQDFALYNRILKTQMKINKQTVSLIKN